MRTLAALALAAISLTAETAHAPLRVSAVRHWRLGEVTRVAIEISGGFKYRSDRLQNPERVYYDIVNARPWINSKRGMAETVDDPLLKRIRVAETVPGITRIVLELGDNVTATPSELINPSRLIVELHGVAAPPPPPVISLAPQPKLPLLSAPAEPKPPAPVEASRPVLADVVTKPVDLPLSTAAALPEPSPLATETHSVTPAVLSSAHPIEAPKPASPAGEPAGVPKSARLTKGGESSLVRALGLKINRVVIDPGHGGHDEGTMGPKGLLEKDLVLDVAMRLGKLIQQRMGAEVVYTRNDDTFIPLEGRTEIANEKKADLFLSIHANSSPSAPRVTGIETYYLNFTQSKDALEVAARENAGSQNSVFDLRDLIQKITLHDKAEESREFAERIQASLYTLSARSFPGEKNRGVRKAPFVVLIGANMPSVLAEIGFLSNAREESLLRRSDYKQKVAEALYRGIARYSESLSHFQVAKN